MGVCLEEAFGVDETWYERRSSPIIGLHHARCNGHVILSDIKQQVAYILSEIFHINVGEEGTWPELVWTLRMGSKAL